MGISSPISSESTHLVSLKATRGNKWKFLLREGFPFGRNDGDAGRFVVDTAGVPLTGMIPASDAYGDGHVMVNDLSS